MRSHESFSKVHAHQKVFTTNSNIAAMLRFAKIAPSRWNNSARACFLHHETMKHRMLGSAKMLSSNQSANVGISCIHEMKMFTQTEISSVNSHLKAQDQSLWHCTCICEYVRNINVSLRSKGSCGLSSIKKSGRRSTHVRKRCRVFRSSLWTLESDTTFQK